MGPVSPQTETHRLMQLPHAQARAQFNDRVARTFLLRDRDPAGFRQSLAFNAHLVTRLRVAGSRMWG